ADRSSYIADFFAHLDQNASAQANPLVISKYGASEDYLGILDCLVRLAKDGTQFALLNFFDTAEIKELLKQKGDADRSSYIADFFAHLDQNASAQANPLVISKYGASEDYLGILDCLVRLAKDGTQFALLNFFIKGNSGISKSNDFRSKSPLDPSFSTLHFIFGIVEFRAKISPMALFSDILFSYLNFSHNQIYGEIPNILMILSIRAIRIDMIQITSKMNEPKKMQYLNLGKNLLSGEINDCWMMWQSLFDLKLGNNSFNGSILASFGFLVSLKYLHLDNNKFSQKLPSSLKNCTNLVIIDISKNEFARSIPSWMGRLSSLVILSLHSNNFHSYILKELCSLTSLQILDLSHNKLLGSIPRCVNNFNAMSLMPTYDNSNDHFVTFMQPIGSSP
ncbi:receptor-like protein eix1, partial [Quercus suber]